jgi:hypothetical protein
MFDVRITGLLRHLFLNSEGILVRFCVVRVRRRTILVFLCKRTPQARRKAVGRHTLQFIAITEHL